MLATNAIDSHQTWQTGIEFLFHFCTRYFMMLSVLQPIAQKIEGKCPSEIICLWFSYVLHVWWMRRPAFWQVPGSSTAAWRSWCMTISIGLTCLSASSIVIILTRRCLIGTAPRYLAADCVPVSEMAQRRHLRSAAGHQLVVPSELTRPSGVLCNSVRDCWTLPRVCCLTLATTLLALDIL